MSGRRKKHRGRGMTVAMLIMLALIIALLIAIGVLLLGKSSGNPLKTAKVMTETYLDSSGSPAGERAYIQISKSALKETTEKQYRSFMNDVVLDKDYILFTIVCEDGTGIVIEPQDGPSVTYGYINQNGQITEIFGTVTDNGSSYQYRAQ